MLESLSIVIPAYNEEGRLPQTLREAVRYLDLKEINYEIIVVSDGSRDATEAACKQFKEVALLVNSQNMGKGYSVRRGVMASTMDYIIFMDADNSTPISEIERFLPYLENYDVLIGSRALAGSKIINRQRMARELTGKLLNLVIQFFFLPGIKDTQCGFKLFKRKAALDIFGRAKINRFVFDVEMLYLAKKLGYQIAEIPITWTNSKPSKVSFFKDSLNILTDLIKIKFLAR